jgi:hypothetical protein
MSMIGYLRGGTNQDMRSGPVVRTMENERKGLKRLV